MTQSGVPPSRSGAGAALAPPRSRATLAAERRKVRVFELWVSGRRGRGAAARPIGSLARPRALVIGPSDGDAAMTSAFGAQRASLRLRGLTEARFARRGAITRRSDRIESTVDLFADFHS